MRVSGYKNHSCLIGTVIAIVCAPGHYSFSESKLKNFDETPTLQGFQGARGGS